jgi:PAS fold
MSLSYFPVSPAANAARITDPSNEAQHLRRVLDTQPACLMRVGTDGCLLAANDAALALLGVEDRNVALGATLMTWMAPEHHDRWRHFAERVVAGTRSSLECDLKTSDGAAHQVILHSVPLLDHTDGVPSMILSIRDVSAVHRLESALQESEALRRVQPAAGDGAKPPQEELEKLVRLLKEGRKHLQDLRGQLEETTAERTRLAAQLAGRASAEEELASARAKADQATAERLALVHKHELELQRKEQEWQQTVDSLRADLGAVTTSRERLEAELREREGASQQLMAAHAQAEQMLAQQHELELQLKEQERQQQLDAVRGDLEAVRANLEEMIHDRDRAILDRDQVVLERDKVIRDRDHAILERDEIIRGRDRLIQERDEIIRGRDQLIQERDQIIRDRDQISREREEVIRDRDEARAQQDEWQRERRQLAEDLSAERARVEELIEMADSARHASDRERANLRVELGGVQAAVRQLTPMAAAGRLALEVAGELTTIVESIDRRSGELLAGSAPDAPFRKDVEALRGEAILAQSLANQVLERRSDHKNEQEESA